MARNIGRNKREKSAYARAVYKSKNTVMRERSTDKEAHKAGAKAVVKVRKERKDKLKKGGK